MWIEHRLKSKRSQWGGLMSLTKKDRKIQIDSGKTILEFDISGPLSSSKFATIVADALHREFGGTNAAVKIVVGFTQANERAVKNWFTAKNAPDGAHLVALARHSDAVLETFLLLAGRKDLLTAKIFGDTRDKVQQMLQLLADMRPEKSEEGAKNKNARRI
jgi:hypothetical protein